MDNDIVVAKKLEFGFTKRGMEGGVSTAGLVYRELCKRIKVPYIVVLSTRDHDKDRQERKHTIFLCPRWVVLVKTFLRVLVKDGELGVQIADSVRGTVFIGTHGLGKERCGEEGYGEIERDRTVSVVTVESSKDGGRTDRLNIGSPMHTHRKVPTCP